MNVPPVETKTTAPVAVRLGIAVGMAGALCLAVGLVVLASSAVIKTVEPSTLVPVTYGKAVVGTVDVKAFGLDSAQAVRQLQVAGGPTRYFVTFEQLYNGVPVQGAYLAAMLKDGKAAYTTGRAVIVNSKASVTPSVSADQAAETIRLTLLEKRESSQDASKQSQPEDSENLWPRSYRSITGEEKFYQFNAVPFDKIKDLQASSRLVFYGQEETAPSLTWEVRLPLLTELPAQFTFFVDAATGAITAIEDTLLSYSVSGTVMGQQWNDPITDNVSTIEPFQHNVVRVFNGPSTRTDAQGSYVLSGSGTSCQLLSNLQGPWAHVYLNIPYTCYIDGQPLVCFKDVEGAAHGAYVNDQAVHNWNWTQYDNSWRGGASNAYYHVNKIHDYAVSLGVAEMNFSMTTRTDIQDGFCNAYYASGSSPSVNFYRHIAQCESTALISDVIYHEYGHGITDKLNPAMLGAGYYGEAGNMHEGLADYWACTIDGDTQMAEGFFVGDATALRTCDSEDQYPQDYTEEPHSGAEIISGALWDIREQLGRDTFDPMLVQALRLQPTTFTEFIDAILAVDDDENPVNLGNGTPHIDTICQSFDGHGLYSPNCLEHTIQPIATILDPTPGSIIENRMVTVYGTAFGVAGEAFVSYSLEYSTDGETWSAEAIALPTNGASAVIGGVLGTWDTSGLDPNPENQLQLRLTVTTATSQRMYSIPLHHVFIKAYNFSVGDIDPDYPGQEIVYFPAGEGGPSGFPLSVIHSDGTTVNGFPQTIMSQPIGRPTLGDIDGDGFLEIVISAAESRFVYAFNHDGSPMNGQWPITIPSFQALQIYLADVAGDELLEIIFTTLPGITYVYDVNGNLLLELPNRTVAAVGDINEDGRDDLVLTYPDATEATRSWLTVYDLSGGEHEGWPVRFATMWPESLPNGSLAVGDINPTVAGQEIVIVGCLDEGICSVYAWDAAGGERGYQLEQPLVERPIWTSRPIVALADVTAAAGDSTVTPEIIVGWGNWLTVLDHAGAPINASWPRQLTAGDVRIDYGADDDWDDEIVKAIATGDFDEDSTTDIAVATGGNWAALYFGYSYYGALYQFRADATEVAEPMTVFLGIDTIATGDANADGSLDAIVTMPYWGLNIFGLPNYQQSAAYDPNHDHWTRFKHDSRNTSFHEAPYLCGDINSSGEINVSDIAYFIAYLFRDGPAPTVMASADVDQSGGINVADITYLIQYVFNGGPAPCQPQATYVPLGSDWTEEEFTAWYEELVE